MRLVLPLVLLLVPLAGCAGGGEGGDDADGGATPAPPAGFVAPEWRLGDHWNYTTSDGGAYTYVVSEDLGDDWRTDVDNPAIAFYDARFDISTVGPIRKSDLAGQQGDQRVLFFQWPLVDGASWDARLDGQDFTVHARQAGPAVFALEMRNATHTYATYRYDSAVRWFTELRFLSPDGSDQFALTLAASGNGFAGPLARYQVAEGLRLEGDIALGGQGTFPVEAGVTDVYLEFDLACTVGGFAAGAGEVQGDQPTAGRTWEDVCPAELHEATVIALPGDEEETHGAFVVGAPTSAGTFRLVMWKRTLEWIG